MESLNAQLQPFIEWLLRTTVQASLLICVILLLQRILRNRLCIRWHYGLWMLLLVRMSLPWAPQSRASLFNLIPRSAHQQQAEYEQQENGQQSVGSDVAGSESVESVPASPAATTQESPDVVTVTPSINRDVQSQLKPDFTRIVKILPLLWLIGALVLAVYVGAGNFNLWRIVKRRRPLTDQKILDLLEDCKSQMGIRTILGIVTTDKVKSPALFGFVRPRLLLPEGMIETLDQQELRYVLLHELAHLKRHDIYIGWLISLLQVLHWFNPLVWLAFYRMRSDRELACDALVLARTQSDEPKSYGRIIVNLVERFSRPQRLPGMAGILETKAHLKRRITMIARFKKNSYQWSPLAVILIIILACISLPDPKRTKAAGVSAAKPAPTMTLRKLAKGGGYFASISPDGRYMCDEEWDTGNLAICELATGRKRRLTSKGSWDDSSEYALDSAISPDSKEVAYLWYDHNTKASSLRAIGLDGSGDRLLCKGKYAMPRDWSADGQKILVVVLENDVQQMVWVSASDGSIRRITSVGKGYPGKFDISPDGRFIAYDRPQAKNTSKRDIFVFDLSEDQEIAVVKHPDNDRLLGWTPDGKYIFFASNRTGTWDGWLLQVGGDEPQGFPKLVKQDIGDVTPIGFTQTGSYYYRNEQTLRDVVVATLDLETGKVLSEPVPVHQTGATIGHDWSPDGRYLAYCTQHPDKTQRIYIRTLATGQERMLADNLYISSLRWSPDGQSILIDRFKRGDSQVIRKIDVQTGERTDLVRSETEVLARPKLSPDGKTLFYIRGDPVSKTGRLVARDLQSGREKELFRNVPPARLTGSALSPDGQRFVLSIVPSQTGPEGPVLEILSAAGGEPRELIQFDKSEKLAAVGVAWMPDSQDVLFWKWFRVQGGKDLELWRISAEGGEPRKLWAWKTLGHLRVHPDGQRIAFNSRSTTSDIWVLENFLPTTVASTAK